MTEELKSGYIFLVRHGLYDDRSGSLNIFGKRDIPLLGAQIDQFLATRTDFNKTQTVMVAGDLPRHRETAEILNELWKLPIVTLGSLAYHANSYPTPPKQVAEDLLPMVAGHKNLILVASAEHTRHFEHIHVNGRPVPAASYAEANVMGPGGQYWVITKDGTINF